jgi:RuvB-like protein 1 (pontin 52)
MIVKTEAYNREQVGKVVQLRANVEGLKLGTGVIERLAAEGEKSSLRHVCLTISCQSKLIISLATRFNF